MGALSPQALIRSARRLAREAAAAEAQTEDLPDGQDMVDAFDRWAELQDQLVDLLAAPEHQAALDRIEALLAAGGVLQ